MKFDHTLRRLYCHLWSLTTPLADCIVLYEVWPHPWQIVLSSMKFDHLIGRLYCPLWSLTTTLGRLHCPLWSLTTPLADCIVLYEVWPPPWQIVLSSMKFDHTPGRLYCPLWSLTTPLADCIVLYEVWPHPWQIVLSSMKFDHTLARLYCPLSLLYESCTTRIWIASFTLYSNHFRSTYNTFAFSIKMFNMAWIVNVHIVSSFYVVVLSLVFLEPLFKGLFCLSNTLLILVSHKEVLQINCSDSDLWGGASLT